MIIKKSTYDSMKLKIKELQRENAELRTSVELTMAAHAKATEAWVLAEEKCDRALEKAMLAIREDRPQ